MTTSTPTRPVPRVDLAATGGARRLPEGWLRALVSGVEAAVLSWLTVVVPAVAAYVATAAAPALGEASWQSAARTGTALWLLAHGGDMAVGVATVSVVPLGMTLLSGAIVYGAVRRVRTAEYGAGVFAVAGFVAAMLLVSFLAPGGRVGALLGGATLASVATALAVRRAGAPAPRWSDRVPDWVLDGVRGAGWALLGLTMLAAGLVAAGLVTGWDRVRMIQDSYMLDTLGVVVMALAQVLFLPTVAVWALAWSAGPGFAVGAGTHFAPGEAVPAPMPAIPLLGGLPAPEAPGPQWVLILPVLVGLVAGVLVHRRRPDRTLGEALGGVAVAAAGVALTTSALVQAASGAIGPGRMAEVGARPPAVAGMLLAGTGGAMLLAVLARHPRTAELLGLGVRRARERVGGVAERVSEARSAAGAAAATGTASTAGTPDDDRRTENLTTETPATRPSDVPTPATPDEPVPDDVETDEVRLAEPAPGPGDEPDRAWDSRPKQAGRTEHDPADEAPPEHRTAPAGPSGGWLGPSLSEWSRSGRLA